MSAKNSVRDTVELGFILEKLRMNYQEISGQRDKAVDPVPFDKLTLQMSQIERLITLSTNKLRMQQKAEEEQARAQALRLGQEHVAMIAELEAKLDDLDQNLFEALTAFYKTVNEELKAVAELQELTLTTSKEAQVLETTPVPLAGMGRMGVVWSDQRDVIAQKLIDAYSLQFWMGYDARGNGIAVRDDFPNVESLSKFGRITDWTPWLVKPEVEPTPEPAAPADVEPLPDPG